METKICRKCGRELPATTDYFYRDKRYREPFRSPCKDCCKAVIDKEHKAAYSKVYREEHKQELSDYHRQYWIENKERYTAYVRANREHFTKSHREYVEKNRERVEAKKREWENANREKRNEQARVHWMKRKAQKVANGGIVTHEDIQAQYKNQNGRCYYCSVNVGKKYHVDHVIPLSRGGSHSPENIVISCPSCNVRKNTKLPHEWSEGGRLL